MSTSITASFDLEAEEEAEEEGIEKTPKDKGMGKDRRVRRYARDARGEQSIVFVSRSYVARGSFVSRRAARRADQAASKGLPSREMKIMSMYRVQKALISGAVSLLSSVLIGGLESVAEMSILSSEEAEVLSVGEGVYHMRKSERLSS